MESDTETLSSMQTSTIATTPLSGVDIGSDSSQANSGIIEEKSGREIEDEQETNTNKTTK